ncbi:hypothetical protein ACLOJK_000737 [Asimina triloba]
MVASRVLSKFSNGLRAFVSLPNPASRKHLFPSSSTSSCNNQVECSSTFTVALVDSAVVLIMIWTEGLLSGINNQTALQLWALPLISRAIYNWAYVVGLSLAPHAVVVRYRTDYHHRCLSLAALLSLLPAAPLLGSPEAKPTCQLWAVLALGSAWCWPKCKRDTG